MTNIYDQKHLPTIPIIDGVVKSPLVAEAQLIRINEGGMKQTGAYEAGVEIEVTHGTVIELLANGNRVIMTVECVDPTLVPVVEPEPTPEPVEAEEAPRTWETDEAPKVSLTERVRIVADDVFGKIWGDLTDKQKTDVLAITQPTGGDFLPPREAFCMPSEFEASKSPVLRSIEIFMGFRDPKKEFGGVDIPEQENFPVFVKTQTDIVISNPPGALIPEPEYDAESVISPIPDDIVGRPIPDSTPCTSDDSCTSSDDACTGDDSCSVSDGEGLSDEVTSR